jgi:pimeloyl-ACP methyl ester carboxylesterase
MGLSERVSTRTYRDRVADISDLVSTLNLTAPIWIVAQDWGGAIAMGYTVAHPDRVAGLVLSNTGIAIPRDRRAPSLIRLAAASGIHRLVTKDSCVERHSFQVVGFLNWKELLWHFRIDVEVVAMVWQISWPMHR